MFPRLGEHYKTRLNGRDVIVRVVESEQDMNRDRRKWVCVNLATGRKVRRTTRQLHPLDVA